MSLAPAAYYALWVLILVLQPVVAYIMVRRKISQEFSYFFYYIVFQALSNLSVFAVYHWGSKGVTQAYSRIYWGCEALGCLLGFAVVFEVFDNTFRPFAALRDFSRVIFRWAGVVLIVVAAVMASTHGSENLSAAMRCILGILAVQRGVMLIQGGLLLFLLMYASRLGMRWQQQTFGIALGLGFSACAHLIVNSLLTQLGMSWRPMYDMLTMVCDNMTLVVWAAYVFFPEPARVTEQAQFEPKPILQRWNHVLSGGEDAVNGGTFIPSMERMVDRVLASQARQSYTELSAPSERRHNTSMMV